MRKAILMILLAIVGSNAMADWLAITATYDNSVTFFVYPEAVRRNGHLVKVWWLESHKNAVTSGNDAQYLSMYFSAKALDEFDCDTVQRRNLAFSEYAGRMGRGEVRYSSDYESLKWSPISPDSVAEALWKYACGK